MDMRVPGIVMAVDKIGLILHSESLHIAVGDGGKFSIGELFSRLKIERGVQHFVLGAGV